MFISDLRTKFNGIMWSTAEMEVPEKGLKLKLRESKGKPCLRVRKDKKTRKKGNKPTKKGEKI